MVRCGPYPTAGPRGAALQADGETRSVNTASSIRRRSAAWTILLDWTFRSRRRASALWSWLLKWQIARFLAAQNTVDVGSGLAKHCGSIRTVGDQSSGCRKRRIYGDCGNAVACQKGRHLRAKRENGNVGR